MHYAIACHKDHLYDQQFFKISRKKDTCICSLSFLCSDSLASLTRSPVSSAGRASDLQAEGRGFESYTG